MENLVGNLAGLAAITIAVLTFVSTQWSLRKKANGDQVNRLDLRVEKLETALKECEQEREELRRDKIALMERIAELA